MDRADDLWDEGNKAEAVAAYTELMDGLWDFEEPRVYQRVVAYHFDEGDEEKATDVCIKAIDEGVELVFERQDLIDLLAFAKTERFRIDAEREAAKVASKQIEDDRQAEEAAARQKKLEAHLAENKARYEALLKPLKLGDERVIRTFVAECDGAGEIWTATVTVENVWHVRAYQLRLQDAQSLFKLWSEAAWPFNDGVVHKRVVRIRIVDLSGNEVGGSRILRGIWVQKQ